MAAPLLPLYYQASSSALLRNELIPSSRGIGTGGRDVELVRIENAASGLQNGVRQLLILVVLGGTFFLFLFFFTLVC